MSGEHVTESSRLTDAEYDAALAELADFEQHIRDSDRLAQEGTLDRAATIARLFADERWIVERNAERVITAKTTAGGRPVDPTSRSQFSTWLRGRFPAIAPRRTYQLLDADRIAKEFLEHVQITPTQEFQLRSLKKLTSVSYGGGDRIVPIWELACHIAVEAGRKEPTPADVRDAESRWKHEHIPATQARRETRFARAERARIKTISAWKAFVELATKDQINAVIDIIERDITAIESTGRPA